MVHDFNSESWRHLMRLRKVAAEFESSNAASLGYLSTALATDADVISRLKEKAEEVRYVLAGITDPLARDILQELADSYEQLGR
jgi:hypothetical protein